MNSNAMNKGYGGVSKRKMHTSLIKDSSYLGTFSNNNTLHVGDVQHMAFQDEDDRPFWMTPEEKLSTKHNIPIEGSTTKIRNKSELLVALRNKGVDTIKNRYLIYGTKIRR